MAVYVKLVFALLLLGIAALLYYYEEKLTLMPQKEQLSQKLKNSLRHISITFAIIGCLGIFASFIADNRFFIVLLVCATLAATITSFRLVRLFY